MVSCTPRLLLGPVRRAVQAKAAGASGAGAGAATAALVVRRVSRPARVCRDAGVLSLAAAGPTATPVGAPPQPPQPAGQGAGAGSPMAPGLGFAVGGGTSGGGPSAPGGPGDRNGPTPAIPLLPERLLFGANDPPGPGDPPQGQPTGTLPVPEVPSPAQVPEPAVLLWLPLALLIVLLVRRRWREGTG